MAIDALRDGFVRMCFDPSLNATQLGCRVLLEGQYYDPALGCTVTPNALMRVTSPRSVDCQFGKGSVLAESIKVFFKTCGASSGIDLFVIPRSDAAGSVKAEYTITFTGTSTSAGTIDIYMGDWAYNTSTYIPVGATPTVIAAAVAANINNTSLPFIATAVAGVITLVARNGGTVGNYLNWSLNWHGRLDYFPVGVTAAMAQTVVGSIDPVAVDYSTLLGDCCYCCIGGLYGDVTWQTGLRDYIREVWNCDKPQCFGHGYTYNAGTLGQILATGNNSAELSRIAVCNSTPILPYLQVAAYAAQSCCTTQDNPELSIQGPEYGVLNAIKSPQSCTTCFTYDEIKQIKANGFVVTTPLSGGQGALTSPVISNDVTNYLYDDEGRPNVTFRDTNSRRMTAKVATEFANKLQEFNGLGLFTVNTQVKVGTKGTNKRLMLGAIRSWAKDNIGTLFSEFDNIDKDISVQTDFEKSPKCQGVPGKMHINMMYRPPIRITEISANMQPKMLDNCN